MRKPPLQEIITKNGPSRQQRPYDEIRDRPVREEPRASAYSGAPTRIPDRRETQYVERAAPVRHPHEPQPRYEEYAGGEYEEEKTRGERRWLFIALGIGGVVILSSVILSLMFAGATVTVFPKEDNVVVSGTFRADAGGANGEVPFERMVIERTASQSVTAQGESTVEERASGKISIYNEYADTPQRLIKNTRFEAQDGKIYRIRESVEVPGKKRDGSPGTIEVTVFAEEAGDSYNRSAAENFTIPGFKGLPQETKVYARSTGEISGGFSGIKRSVSEADRKAALEGLEAKLRDELTKAAVETSDKPEGYLFFDEAVFFEFAPLPDEAVEGDKVTVTLSGKLHAVLFPKRELTERLATLSLESYEGSEIRLESPEEITLTLSVPARTPASEEEGSEEGSTAASVPWQGAQYEVAVQGQAHFIWEFDEAQLARDLAGKPKSAITVSEGGVLEAYPGIDRLQATVRPFWKRTFPNNSADITIVRELDA